MDQEYQNITAQIKNATIVSVGDNKVLLGDIYNDTRHRWVDGTFIQSSFITKISNNIIKTRNSTYEVVSWVK